MPQFISKLILLALLWPMSIRAIPLSERTCSTSKAIYFITNDGNNAVAAVPIGDDGTLSGGTVTETCGKGANSIDGTTNQPAAPDALVSQSAVSVAGQYLFAVNAGSNTLSMLSIDAQDPTKLTMVGEPASVPGEFPNTLAASMKNKIVCVGSTGAKAGVSCSSFSQKGLGKMDSLREFNIGQSTPPVGPTNTVSQVLFSNDESTLLTMVKGDPTVNNTGFVATFPVNQASFRRPASISMDGTLSSPSGTAVLFGTEPIPGTENFFVTDASFGGTILSLDQKAGQLSLKSKQAIGGQKATCWTTISQSSKSAFVTDVQVNHIVEMSLDNARIIKEYDTSSVNAGPGFIDLAAAGNFVYALSPGNGTSEANVVVMDVSGGQGKAKIIQTFGLGALGAGKNSQGMVAI
ncbi:hypothetical protein C8Q69DRAFT_509639 [Paecilomyces variotii]|uniref:3-carboxymuconate cyclase n=1 Tax=Byssochlamys spectabilis TaxID=264951 RepID=A0A443HMM8_BYSSP|nr:hypothetical protein C8Q69DRAFT_509639 [Paecilomyces variotii]KAJ9353642.1 hypothetical protein DTO280E4_7235 [Paecilomyces variotii]RWQ93064.1 hypothetical protein C8Q69DRAFT_509639 [Paecilomyces variotii]